MSEIQDEQQFQPPIQQLIPKMTSKIFRQLQQIQ